MGATTRAAALNGQQWIGGIYPPGDARLHWADDIIRRAIGAYGCELWADANDVAASSGDAVETWPARCGVPPTQATVGKRPTFQRGASVSSLEFGGVDDALSTGVDLSATNGASVYVVARLDSTAATTVLFEYSAAYHTNAGLVCGVDSSAQFWTGMGPGSSALSYRNSTATVPTTPAVYAARYLRDTPAQLTQHTVFGGELVENTSFSAQKTGANTDNFGAFASWIGARNNGAERQLVGGIYEIVIVPAYVPDIAHNLIIRALAVKGGLL